MLNTRSAGDCLLFIILSSVLLLTGACQNKQTQVDDEVFQPLEEVEASNTHNHMDNLASRIGLPDLSQFCEINQMIGIDMISVRYYAPSSRGREKTIWGDVIPYEKMWKMGANYLTTISFSCDVTVEGKSLEKGVYAMTAVPSKASAKIYFYQIVNDSTKDSTQRLDSRNLDELIRSKKIIEKTNITVLRQRIDGFYKTMTFKFSDLSYNTGTCALVWGDSKMEMLICVDNHDRIRENLEEHIQKFSMKRADEKGEVAETWDLYMEAAIFYKDIDIHLAKEYIYNAIREDSTRYVVYNTLASVLATNNEFAEASKAQEKAIEVIESSNDLGADEKEFALRNLREGLELLNRNH